VAKNVSTKVRPIDCTASATATAGCKTCRRRRPSWDATEPHPQSGRVRTLREYTGISLTLEFTSKQRVQRIDFSARFRDLLLRQLREESNLRRCCGPEQITISIAPAVCKPPARVALNQKRTNCTAGQCRCGFNRAQGSGRARIAVVLTRCPAMCPGWPFRRLPFVISCSGSLPVVRVPSIAYRRHFITLACG